MNITAADPASPDALALTAELEGALQAITGDSGASSFDPEDVRGPRAALETAARRLGYEEVRLSTRRINARAVDFYRRHGYPEAPAWGKYVGSEASSCLGRTLLSPRA